MISSQKKSTLFPYTTLFRSGGAGCRRAAPFLRSARRPRSAWPDRKSTRLNSSHVSISYAVFCLKKKNKQNELKDKTLKQIADNSGANMTTIIRRTRHAVLHL